MLQWQQERERSRMYHEFLNTGILASIQINQHRDPKKGTRAAKPEDFIPEWIKNDPQEAQQVSRSEQKLDQDIEMQMKLLGLLKT